jgi:hypothetical protein
MGIDAQAFSKDLPKQFLGRAKGKSALRAIERTAKDWSVANEFGPLYCSQLLSDGSLMCAFNPLADWIRFQLTNDGVVVGFRSSSVGPGYHAAVIDMLDYLASELQMSWDWGGAGNMCADETGYALSRSFEDLQFEMVRFFQLLIETAADHNQNGGALCLPYGLGQDRGEISCPLGPRCNDWLTAVTKLRRSELVAEAAGFFPWWNKERDHLFWENMLTGTLWQNAQWRAPVTNEERQTIVAIAHLNEKVRSHDLPLKSHIQEAVDELAKAVQDDEPPGPEGIGYRRGYVDYNPFPGWRISLPGHFRELEDPEGKAGIFQHGTTVFRISSITANRKSDSPFKWPSLLEIVETETVNDMMWRRERSQDHGDSFSQFSLLVHESAERHQVLMLTITTNTSEELQVLEDWVSRIKYGEPKRDA